MLPPGGRIWQPIYHILGPMDTLDLGPWL